MDAKRSPFFYRVISGFEAETGCPVVINTSFNVRGEPVVCSPEDAWRCFMRSGIDSLVVEDCVLKKEDQEEREVVMRKGEGEGLSEWEEKWFGWLLGLFSLGFGALLFWKFSWRGAAIGVWAVGGMGALMFQAVPSWRRKIYQFWMRLVYPIGWMVSHVMMTLIYFLVFTPVAFIMKVVGYDPLKRKWEREEESYLIKREEARKPSDYLRQF